MNDPKPPQTWVMIGDAARRAGVHRETVEEWIDDRLVASRRLPGSSVKVCIEDVDRLVSNSTTPSVTRTES